MIIKFHLLSRNWNFFRDALHLVVKSKTLCPHYSWCTQSRPHGFWSRLCCNDVNCIRPFHSLGCQWLLWHGVASWSTHIIQWSTMVILLMGVTDRPGSILYHSLPTAVWLWTSSVLRASASGEGVTTSTLNCGLEPLMRRLCEMTCVVSIAHKNSLNGSLSYFYLPKEIEVGEGIDSRVMELGSSPILPVRAGCF